MASGKNDFIVYTGSDPHACHLEDYLREGGFIVIDSPSDCAMVVVTGTTRQKLGNAIRASNLDEGGYFRVRKVASY